MVYGDLDIALSFLSVQDQITIQHSSRRDRHLLISYIRLKMGLPSRNDFYGLKYGDKYIHFETAGKIPEGLDDCGAFFFVPRCDEDFVVHLEKLPPIPTITGAWAGM